MYRLAVHIYPGCNFKIVHDENQEVVINKMEYDQEIHAFSSDKSFGVALYSKKNLIALVYSEKTDW